MEEAQEKKTEIEYVANKLSFWRRWLVSLNEQNATNLKQNVEMIELISTPLLAVLALFICVCWGASESMSHGALVVLIVSLVVFPWTIICTVTRVMKYVGRSCCCSGDMFEAKRMQQMETVLASPIWQQKDANTKAARVILSIYSCDKKEATDEFVNNIFTDAQLHRLKSITTLMIDAQEKERAK